MPRRFDRRIAEEVLGDYLPLISRLNEQGVDYCVVGGLAVLMQAYVRGATEFRATEDLNILVPETYSNADFASDYERVYEHDALYAHAVYDATFGDGAYEALSAQEQALVNISFGGVEAMLGEAETLDVDVRREFNGRTAASIPKEQLVVLGVPVLVATADELLAMKRETIDALCSMPGQPTRIQDFQDVETLKKFVGD